MHGAYLETSCIETNNPILVKSANKYMKNKTKDEIIDQMINVMPFSISGNIRPYVKEAMDIYAENEVRAYKTQSIINLIEEWDIFKKQNWWESEAIDVEKVLLDRFIDKIQGKQSFEIDYDWDDIEQCPTCGDLDGRVNPCCKGYDPLHINNCGFG